MAVRQAGGVASAWQRWRVRAFFPVIIIIIIILLYFYFFITIIKNNDLLMNVEPSGTCAFFFLFSFLFSIIGSHMRATGRQRMRREENTARNERKQQDIVT